MGEIRVGTSGYSFPDWVGTVYPRELPQKAWLSYYARWFNAVEINSTYYRIPSPYMMAALVRKVPKGFLFTVKVPKEMTHERGRFEEAVGPFLEAISPMVQAECLASLLAQFPYSLPRGDPQESLAHLLRLREAIPAEIPVHVEFRHAFFPNDSKDFWNRLLSHPLRRESFLYFLTDAPCAAGELETPLRSDPWP